METITRHSHVLPKNLNSINHFIPKTQIQTPIQINLPLYRPQFKPIIIKKNSKKSNPKPVTTTSDILHLMDALKLPISIDIYSSLIKECTELRDSCKSIELLAHVKKSGIRLTLPLLNRLLLMLVSCGCFEDARQLFDQMFVRDFNSWAVVIASYIENANWDEAIDLFIEMLCVEEFDSVSDHQRKLSIPGILVCFLKSCVSVMDLELGMQVHGWIWKMGYSENIVLRSSLINFYGKMKSFENSHRVFEQNVCRNTVVWTARIVNYCRDGLFEEVVDVFNEMGREGLKKNSYTFSSVVKACGGLADIECGRQVHANSIKLGLESDSYVLCALIDMYGKCGFLKDAIMAFEFGRNERNGACCNAMLMSYLKHGYSIEAIKILYEMKRDGFRPGESLFNEVLSGCRGGVFEKEMCL